VERKHINLRSNYLKLLCARLSDPTPAREQPNRAVVANRMKKLDNVKPVYGNYLVGLWSSNRWGYELVVVVADVSLVQHRIVNLAVFLQDLVAV
jgi:hypothetical protein